PGVIVPLREHLRSDEDVHALGAHLVQHRLQRPLAARDVAVDASDARLGEGRLQACLDALRALSERCEVEAAAARAGGGNPLAMTAMMATQLRGGAVHDEIRAAARARRVPEARAAGQGRRETARRAEDGAVLALL